MLAKLSKISEIFSYLARRFKLQFKFLLMAFETQSTLEILTN